MVNLSKKWGAVIGCWCVALVLVVTGICLALTIPSSAAEDDAANAVVLVTCGDTKKYINDINEVGIYLNQLAKPGTDFTVKLLKDIHTDETIDFIPNGDVGGYSMVLDLAGHILQSNEQVRLGCTGCGSLTIIDSNPTITRYVSRVDINGSTYYTFYGENGVPAGVYADEIKGGVVASSGTMELGVFYGGNKLTINGGNYFGKGYLGVFGMMYNVTDEDKEVIKEAYGFLPSESLIINSGLFQLYEDSATVGSVGVQIYASGNLVINGGSIYGKVGYSDEDEYSDGVVVDLTNPQVDAVKINENLKMQETEIDGVKVYTAVDKTTDKPITPEQPETPTTDQPANTTHNMLGIVVLGAATVVMLAGVGTAIGLVVKRRKRKAA